MGQLLVRLWDNDGGSGLGVLTKAALALASLRFRHLQPPKRPPTPAMDHALLLLGDSCDEVHAAWQTIGGTDLLFIDII